MYFLLHADDFNWMYFIDSDLHRFAFIWNYLNFNDKTQRCSDLNFQKMKLF